MLAGSTSADRTDRHILLIGIVKKDAIMMIDFALDAERHDGLRRKPQSIARACCGLSHHDDHMAARLGGTALRWERTGAEIRQPLGLCDVGPPDQQFLTLYTTPSSICIVDRLTRFSGRGNRGGAMRLRRTERAGIHAAFIDKGA